MNQKKPSLDLNLMKSNYSSPMPQTRFIPKTTTAKNQKVLNIMEDYQNLYIPKGPQTSKNITNNELKKQNNFTPKGINNEKNIPKFFPSQSFDLIQKIKESNKQSQLNSENTLLSSEQKVWRQNYIKNLKKYQNYQQSKSLQKQVLSKYVTQVKQGESLFNDKSPNIQQDEQKDQINQQTPTSLTQKSFFHFPQHNKSSSLSTTKTIQLHHRKETNISSDEVFKNHSAVLLNNKANMIKVPRSPKLQMVSTIMSPSLYYLKDIEQSFKQPIQNDYFSQIYREHFMQTYQGIMYSNLAKPANSKDLEFKKVQMKQREAKYQKTIVFDLDETLIHCNENTSIPHDVKLLIKFPMGEVVEAGVNIRPFAKDILEELSKEFEIIVFTASHNCYAKAVLDYLDPQNKYIHYRFYRDNCIQTLQGVYIKDLRIFQGRSLEDMVIVDNASYSFSFQIENGIPIIPFYHHKDDKELKKLLIYLKNLKDCKDVREVNKQLLKLHLFNDSDGSQKVQKNLFGQKN